MSTRCSENFVHPIYCLNFLFFNNTIYNINHNNNNIFKIIWEINGRGEDRKNFQHLASGMSEVQISSFAAMLCYQREFYTKIPIS